MVGINPEILDLAGVSLLLDPCPDRDFYESTFQARASVIMPIGKQRSGEWAVLVIWLEDPKRSSSGGKPTMNAGDLCIVRDSWLS